MATPGTPEIIVGTAGWAIASAHRDSFGEGTSALARYATRFGGVEINSSFYRQHRPATWMRWAQTVPTDFQFSVKMPRAISHTRRLVACETEVDAFLEQCRGLGQKLGVLLLQLPPSLVFDEPVARRFFTLLRLQTHVAIACEPRHPSWFEPGADTFLKAMTIARVAVDPAVVPAAAMPGGWRGLAYLRLHGSPIMYRSAYTGQQLADYAHALPAAAGDGGRVWCMFDNTASSAATGDALALTDMLDRQSLAGSAGCSS